MINKAAFVVFLLLALSAAALVAPVGVTESQEPANAGSRPRNLAVSSDGATVLTTSLGSDYVVQMRRNGSSWDRTTFFVGAGSWDVEILEIFGMEYAVVTLPGEDHIQVLFRSPGQNDFQLGWTIDVPYGCTTLLPGPAGDKFYVANRGLAPEPDAVNVDVEEWQHAVYEYSFPMGTLTRTFVTDREPRALALSPNGDLLLVSNIQGALGGAANDATTAGSGDLADHSVSFPAHDGGSIIAFKSGDGLPEFRIKVGSPVRGVVVHAVDADSYRLFSTPVG